MASSWDPGKFSGGGRLKLYMRFIRVEHTLFSLPFCYAAAFTAKIPDIWQLIWITLALFGLRTASMAFNNIADREIDAKNPRTCRRPLVTGEIKLSEAWAIVLLGSLLFFLSAAVLNIYALAFSPLVYAISMSYPYSKRFHCMPHLHLGLVLGLSVFGGAVGSYGAFASGIADLLARVPWTYMVFVVLWMTGVDTIYSVMDVDFDKRYGIGSLPKCIGVKWSKIAALLIHILSALVLLTSSSCYLSLFFFLSAAAVFLAGDFIAIARGDIALAFNLNLAVPFLSALGQLAHLIIA